MEKHYISNKNESIRIFKSDIMDTLSRTHWSLPLIFYVPIISFMLYISINKYRIESLKIFEYYLFGLFFWTFTEYIMHRFVFHYKPNSVFGKRLHFSLHGIHHAYPNDSKRLVMVPGISLILAFVFFWLFYFTIGKINVYGFNAGFLSGYLYYDMIHYAVHHNRFKNKILLAIKRNHMRHHFNQPDDYFGVSQPLWDFIFGTYTYSGVERDKG